MEHSPVAPCTASAVVRLVKYLLCMLLWLLSAGTASANDAPWPAVLVQQAELSSLAGQRSLALPHSLQAQDFDPAGSRVRYRLTLDLPTVPQQALGIFVRKMSLSGNVYLNGHLLGACERGPLESLRCLHKPYLFVPPLALWQAGHNTLEFEIYATARQKNGLSAVEVGDAAALTSSSYQWWAWWQIDVVQGLTWLAVLVGSLCLLIGLIVRRDSAYFWYGLTCLAYAISNVNQLISHLPFSLELFNWLAFSSRMVSNSLLFAAGLSLFPQAPAWCKRVSIAFAMLAPIVVWLTASKLSVMLVLFMVPMLFCPVVLLAMVYWMRQSYSPLQLYVMFLNVTFFASGIADWLRLGGQSAFEGVYLTTYTYGLLLIAFCATLVGLLAMSLEQTRLLSVSLTRNVYKQKMQLEQKEKDFSGVAEALRNMQAMALKLSENIPVGMYATTIDAQGESKFSFVSDRFLEMLDLQREPVLADLNLAIERMHPEDRPAFIALNRQTDATHSAMRWEGRYVVRGQVLWMRVESTPRMTEAGKYVWDGLLTDITDLKTSQLALQNAHAQLVASEINRSKLEERERMLEDLHDGFGSELAGARMLLEQGSMTQAQMSQVLAECLADLHLMVDTLGNFTSTIESAADAFRYRIQRRLTSFNLQLHWNIQLAGVPALPTFKVLQILRIAQEALNNALKHAQASNISIALVYHDQLGQLRLCVADDGRGFAAPTGHGRGQSNMQSRARKLGAELAVESGAAGTQVLLLMPL